MLVPIMNMHLTFRKEDKLSLPHHLLSTHSECRGHEGFEWEGHQKDMKPFFTIELSIP